MNYSYDPEADALYICVQSAKVDRQFEMGDGVIVDLALDGSLIGIDVMDPSAGWDAHEVIATHHLAGTEADLLRSLAAVRSWSPLRGRSRPAQVTSGSVEPDPLVETLA